MRRDAGVDDGSLVLLQTCQCFFNLVSVFLVKLKLQFRTHLKSVGIIGEYMARVRDSTEFRLGGWEE